MEDGNRHRMTPTPTTLATFYQQDFTLDPNTGQLCISKGLDFERTAVYDIPVLATDRGKSFYFFCKTNKSQAKKKK